MKIRPALALLVMLGATACGDDDSGNHGTPDARRSPDAYMPDADFGDVPRVEPAACKFMMSATLGLTEGTDYACGDLVVEENRATHAGRIRLHFIRIESATPTTHGTIYLDGGPGGDGQGILDYAAYLGAPFLNALLVDGDFLVIGQRGTGYSVPYLDCQQQDCGDFAAIADLPSYNTAYNADDVDDLRATLGLDLLNVYGISYGSRLGLEVIRRHGDKLRAAVIEGLVPPQIHWPAAIPASVYGAMVALNQSCTDAGMCGTTFGNLLGKFTTGVDALNNNPVTITTSAGDIPLDGYSYAYLVFRMLYAKSSYAWLPLIINDLATRRTDRINSTLAAWITNDRGGISMGLYYSVVCGELYNPTDPDAVANANIGVPAEYMDLFGGSYESLADTCSNWPKGNLQSTLNPPVISSVRTLVSSGRLDPITPPSFGTVAASSLSSSESVTHENSGHGATLQSACGTANLSAFLANPTATHDLTCAATITTSYQVPGAFTGPTISIAQIRAELAVAPVAPFIRDRLRRRSAGSH